MDNLRWKAITILAVLVIFSVVGVYLINAARSGINSPSWLVDKQLKLGLDLKGGVHLVIRVQTDDALRLQTETEMERLREELKSKNVSVTSIASPDPRHFKVDGVQPPQEQQFRQIAGDVTGTDFDRGGGVGGSYTFTMKPNIQINLRDEAVVQ